MDNTEIKILKFNSPQYKQSLALRDDILRKPLGMSIYDDDLSDENLQIHIAYINAEEVLGVLLLKRVTETEIKMRQVAVNESYQRKGIGAAIVIFAEDIAKKNDYQKITLHARTTAVEFYEKLGYTKMGDEFLEVGIPHITMEKDIL